MHAGSPAVLIRFFLFIAFVVCFNGVHNYFVSLALIFIQIFSHIRISRVRLLVNRFQFRQSWLIVIALKSHHAIACCAHYKHFLCRALIQPDMQ